MTTTVKSLINYIEYTGNTIPAKIKVLIPTTEPQPVEHLIYFDYVSNILEIIILIIVTIIFLAIVAITISLIACAILDVIDFYKKLKNDFIKSKKRRQNV